MIASSILSIVKFAPLIGAALLLVMIASGRNRNALRNPRWIAVITTLVIVLVAWFLLAEHVL